MEELSSPASQAAECAHTCAQIDGQQGAEKLASNCAEENSGPGSVGVAKKSRRDAQDVSVWGSVTCRKIIRLTIKVSTL
jgi:hypothetical protein